MDSVVPILLLATLGSVAGLLGGMVLIFNQKWAKRLSQNAIPFAAGVLLAIVFLDLLPEAVEKGSSEKVFLLVLVVMLAAFVFEELILRLHHHEEQSPSIKSTLPLVVAGDTVHNFIDGTVIAAAYLTEPSLGLLVALATFFHETPHEIGDFGLMLAGGWSKAKTLVVNVLSSLSTYVGSLFVLFFANSINFGLLLASAAGMLLYIAASDLLPHVHEGGRARWKNTALLLAGVLLIYIVSVSLG